ncbi:MAG: twin-arginine translocation signal domain-containing protein [Chloroflexota bacterium]|nr:twin-arginine translocation signal domain-containing protein [Chloroflexota bacterium]
MARYLLFDSACAACSSLAIDIARETDGILAVRGLHEPFIQDALNRGRPGWRWEPTLLETDGDIIRVSTGLPLRTRLLGLLGPRRAWCVAQLVAEAQVPLISAKQSRRGFVKHGAAVGAGLAGAILLGPGPGTVQAQGDDNESAEFEAQGRNKPGKHSRKAGIRRWRVRKKGSGYTVMFEHRDRKLSGQAEINFSNGGTTGSFVLSLRRDRLQLAVNLERGTFAGSDGDGRATSGVRNRRRNRWEVSPGSERVLRGSRQEFRTGFAILADLAPSRRRARGSSTAGASDEITTSQVRCFDNYAHATSGPGLTWFLVDARDIAKTKIAEACDEMSLSPCKGRGCCRQDEELTVCLGIPYLETDGVICTCQYRGSGYASC